MRPLCQEPGNNADQAAMAGSPTCAKAATGSGRKLGPNLAAQAGLLARLSHGPALGPQTHPSICVHQDKNDLLIVLSSGSQ